MADLVKKLGSFGLNGKLVVIVTFTYQSHCLLFFIPTRFSLLLCSINFPFSFIFAKTIFFFCFFIYSFIFGSLFGVIICVINVFIVFFLYAKIYQFSNLVPNLFYNTQLGFLLNNNYLKFDNKK